MTVLTADLCDDHADVLQVATPMFQSYGANARFAGPISTLKCHEDNTHVRTALDEPGQGRVLVIDGGGSLRCALVGGNLGKLAEDNGWAGIVVNGCIRDAVEINAQNIGVRALNTNPTKSIKNNVGERELVVRFADVTFTPGHWLYADEDGIAVAPEKLGRTSP